MALDRTELRMVGLATAVVVAARLGSVAPAISSVSASVARSIAVPVAVLVTGLVVSVAVSRRSPAVLGILIVSIVVIRAGQQVESLRLPMSSGVVTGQARLISDPIQRDFDVQAFVAVDGRRYVASMPSSGATTFKGLQVGETFTVRGTPRSLDGAPSGWVLANHLSGRLGIDSVTSPTPAAYWYRVANGIRSLIARSGGSMAPDDRALYLGLVVGDDRDQSELQKYRFRASGLTHLLAVSGQNVAFVLAIASPLTRRMGPRGSLAVAIPLLAVFALVTRAEPSVLRAVVMASIGLLAIATGRKVKGIRMLSLTIIGLVVIDPLIVHSMAFTLSVSATAGLILFASPIAGWLRGPSWLTEPLAVTMAAQLATAPVLFTMTGSLPAVATPANLLAVPVSGFVMMAGLTCGLVAGSMRSDVASFLMWPVTWMVRWVDWVATTASRVPMAQLTPRRMVVLIGVVAVTAVVRHRLGVTRRFGAGPHRLAVGVTGAVVVVGLLVPRPPTGGVVDLGDGANLSWGACGESVVAVTKGVHAIAVLETLTDIGVTSVDVAVSDDSRSAQRASRYLQEQFGAAPTYDDVADPGRAMVSGRDPPGFYAGDC